MVVTLCTYNSQGLSAGRIEYIKDLCRSHDIVLIQETWLLNDNLKYIEDRVPGVTSHGVSSIDDSSILVGRPYGGCSILWKKSMVCNATPITNISKRMCAVNFKLPSGLCILVVNVYMPCDHIVGNLPEYRGVLDEIAGMVAMDGVDYLILGGDWNTDFVRNSQNTIALNAFIETESLVKGSNFPLSKVDFTYESKMNGQRSTLDHFLLSENLFLELDRYVSIYDGDNLSDHSPVSMALKLESDNFMDRVRVEARNTLNWSEANAQNINDYQHSLDDLLNIDMPNDLIECHHLQCTNNHNLSIEYLYGKVVEACTISSNRHIPGKIINGKSKVIPGWNEDVLESKRRAIFWHNLWKSNDSPRNGIIADIRRRTRAQYHLAIKTAKRNKDKHISNSIATSLLEKNDKNFWKGIKRANPSSNRMPNNIDGHIGKEAICEHLAQKYETLYNSVSYDHDEMDLIMSDIDDHITSKCCDGNLCTMQHQTTVDEITQAVKSLKYNKNDGFSVLSTNHLKYGTHRLHVLISLLFTSMLRNGYVPEDMLCSTIMPIPKNARKSINESSNYRGIALNSPLCKLFEIVILQKCQDTLKSSDMQFGYKKGVSTTECTATVNEITQYYLNGGGQVYAMLLDASQAFDRVQYTGLLKILLKRGICPVMARIIAYLYMNQKMRIRWEDHHSEFFNVSNGVKQGGILSPFLFSIYIDVLLLKLKGSGFGCHVGSTFAGAFAYADDIIILCPTKFALNAQLKIAVTYSIEYRIKFNPTKCQLLYFRSEPPGRRVEPIVIVFQGTRVTSEGTALHLGHIIGPEVKNDNINKSISDFNRRVNVLMSRFYYCNFETKIKLFKSFCMSLYGSGIWDLSENCIEIFYTAWRKAVRKICGVNPRTHCSLLPLIIGSPYIKTTVTNRFMNFYRRVNNSENIYIKLAGCLSMAGSGSSISKNLSLISHEVEIPRAGVPLLNCMPVVQNEDGVLQTSAAIRDFLKLRDNVAAVDRNNLNIIINLLCTE